MERLINKSYSCKSAQIQLLFILFLNLFTFGGSGGGFNEPFLFIFYFFASKQMNNYADHTRETPNPTVVHVHVG